MNETPEFMKACLFGARRGWRMSWVVQRAADKCGVEKEAILNRPKTPHDKEIFTADACTWLSRWFNPVFLGIAAGKTDAELMRIWIKTDRAKQPAVNGRISSKDWTQIYRYRRETSTTKYIRARDLDKRWDWATVK